MSKDPEKSVKAELNKHINSKLFQKFLVKEAAKIPEVTQVKKNPKPVLRKSPERIVRVGNEEFDEENRKSAMRQLNKSVSQRSSLRNLKEFSPAPQSRSPVRMNQVYDMNFSEGKSRHYDSPDALKPPWVKSEEPMKQNYFPVYTVDPLLLKQYEADKNNLIEELKITKERYEGIVKKKNDEIKRIQKILDTLKLQNSDLQEKLVISEENERKLGSLKAERDILDRKVHSLESDVENARRQLEYEKDNNENFKNQIEEVDRSGRTKTQDVERELRIAKDRNEELERQLMREKERFADMERKLNKSKDRNFAMQGEVTRAEEKIKRLENDLQETKERLSNESSQQLRETEILRRKIEDLTQGIMRKDRSEDLRKEFYDTKKDLTERFYQSQRELHDIRKDHSDSRHDDYQKDYSDYNRDYPNRRKTQDNRRDHWGNHRENLENYRNNMENHRENTENVVEMHRETSKKRIRDPNEFADRRSDPITWKNKDPSPKNQKADLHRGMENKLMSMQMDKQRLEDELAKIPPSARRIVHIKRKEEIEMELEILNANISSIKSRLRGYNAL
ncbi:hypothetical protein SteCoe_26420 [Stentor coeruleus]|uniref:Enkurin domain-containing protein n=1 Tax=Stentor coeruleus TaxID=5963 RepID=A0A1R2BCU4_9CILI|nr:hypothetical protein SteCoe_26420 [Stentor coeruleus]